MAGIRIVKYDGLIIDEASPPTKETWDAIGRMKTEKHDRLIVPYYQRPRYDRDKEAERLYRLEQSEKAFKVHMTTLSEKKEKRYDEQRYG